MNNRQKKKQFTIGVKRATENAHHEYDWCRSHHCKYYVKDKFRSDYHMCGLHFGFCHGKAKNL